MNDTAKTGAKSRRKLHPDLIPLIEDVASYRSWRAQFTDTGDDSVTLDAVSSALQLLGHGPELGEQVKRILGVD